MTSQNVRFYLLTSLVIVLMTACNALPQPIEPTSTRNFTGATLQPSPTVQIRNSDEIYGDTILDGQSNATAAALPVDAPLPPASSGFASDSGAQLVQILLEDGTPLNGELYEQAGLGQRVIGVLIVAEEINEWRSLATALFDAGYTVLVMDIPQNPQAEIMDTLLRSLSENGTVDPARILAIGAGTSADLAFLGCTIFEICDAVVMLSPQSRNAILNVIPSFNPRPLFVAASQNDTESYNTALAISTMYAEGSVFAQQTTGAGTGLLALNSELGNSIVAWISTVWE